MFQIYCRFHPFIWFLRHKNLLSGQVGKCFICSYILDFIFDSRDLMVSKEYENFWKLDCKNVKLKFTGTESYCMLTKQLFARRLILEWKKVFYTWEIYYLGSILHPSKLQKFPLRYVNTVNTLVVFCQIILNKWILVVKVGGKNFHWVFML